MQKIIPKMYLQAVVNLEGELIFWRNAKEQISLFSGEENSAKGNYRSAIITLLHKYSNDSY